MKKKWIPHIIAAAALVGFVVLGLASVTVEKGATTTTYADGRREIVDADGNKTVIDLNTDGKGGKIIVKNISSSEYWCTNPFSTSNSGIQNMGKNSSGTTLIEKDGEYTIFYRPVRDGDNSWKFTDEEIRSTWMRKTVYVSNDETVEINIPY